MTPKSFIVLRALLQGQTLDLEGVESRLIDNQICMKTMKIVMGPNENPRPQEIWLSTEVSLRGFLQMCEDLTDDDAMIIAANTAITENGGHVMVMPWKQEHRQKQNIKKYLYKKQHGRCAYCNRKFDKDKFTIDHVVPQAKGGKTSMNNCVLACFACKQAKADLAPDLGTLQKQNSWLRAGG